MVPALPTQITHEGTWIAVGEQERFGVSSLSISAGEAPMPETSIVVTPTLLENRYLRVEFDQAGDITRIYDKTCGRDVLPADAVANQFQAFEDRPLKYDAWDIDVFFEDKIWTADPATSVEVVEAGPLRATLKISRRILRSEYVQHVSLRYNSARLDIETTIDWQERHVLLKAAFPVDILSPVATYEIQWGNVERPTHRNTSWDWARFETCAQKWVDLSEGDYGVSLLNDCKYGHDIKDNVIRISLLRSPSDPDPEADRGEHRFAYSLLPHAGSWGDLTIAEAYCLNDPLIVAEGKTSTEPSGAWSPTTDIGRSPQYRCRNSETSGGWQRHRRPAVREPAPARRPDSKRRIRVGGGVAHELAGRERSGSGALRQLRRASGPAPTRSSPCDWCRPSRSDLPVP